MLTDIVIDTNVLVQAQNPNDQRFSDSFTFINQMFSINVLVCVDEGFTLDITRNRSFIAYEYLDKIRFGSLSYIFLVFLSNNLRIRMLNKRAPFPKQKVIQQLISNKRDRIFLAVAFNSDSHVLVSHDFTDFPNEKRVKIQKRLSVCIVEASEVIGIL